MKADAKRYCWLRKVARTELVKIAHRFPLAQDYQAVDNCIDAAMGTRLLANGVEADARRYRWLKKADPMKLAAIAYRIPEACSHPAMDPDGCIDAALGVDGVEERSSITTAISNERAYQDAKYGSIVEHPHCIGGWLTIMRHELREAEEAWYTDAVLKEILQVIAVGHACLEQHGVVERC